MPDLFTLGQISTRLRMSPTAVRYIIDTRKIAPALTLGGRRAFDAAAVEKIAEAGEKIKRDRARSRRAS